MPNCPTNQYFKKVKYKKFTYHKMKYNQRAIFKKQAKCNLITYNFFIIIVLNIFQHYMSLS